MATIRSSVPLAVTSTPVRCGRVSSREAARATRAIVSTNAPAGTVSPPSAGASGSFGKSSVGSVRRWNFDGARHHLHVLLGAPVLERQVVLRQRAHDVEQEAAGHDGLARRGVGRARARRARPAPCRWPGARRGRPPRAGARRRARARGCGWTHRARRRRVAPGTFHGKRKASKEAAYLSRGCWGLLRGRYPRGSCMGSGVAAVRKLSILPFTSVMTRGGRVAGGGCRPHRAQSRRFAWRR